MATVTREYLSGSTTGRPIQVTATTAGGANTVHTSDATLEDEIYVWAANVSASAVPLSLHFDDGGTDNEYYIKTVSIPANSALIPIFPGITVSGSTVLKAFAGTTAVINLSGHVNRITN
jgi:hypothetical protein